MQKSLINLYQITTSHYGRTEHYFFRTKREWWKEINKLSREVYNDGSRYRVQVLKVTREVADMIDLYELRGNEDGTFGEHEDYAVFSQYMNYTPYDEEIDWREGVAHYLNQYAQPRRR